MPGEDEEVIALAPAAEAPKTILIAANSDSLWIKTLPISCILFDIYSGISFCGVIG